MAHARKLLRDAVVAQLTGLATTGLNVEKSRVYPVTTLPALLVYTNTEGSSRATLGGLGGGASSLMRTVVFSIEGYAKTVGAIDDILDTIAEEVEIALGDDETLGGLCEDIRLVGTEMQLQGDPDQPVGVVKMDYEVVYRTKVGNPSVTL